jgi:hypothetical protein
MTGSKFRLKGMVHDSQSNPSIGQAGTSLGFNSMVQKSNKHQTQGGFVVSEENSYVDSLEVQNHGQGAKPGAFLKDKAESYDTNSKSVSSYNNESYPRQNMQISETQQRGFQKSRNNFVESPEEDSFRYYDEMAENEQTIHSREYQQRMFGDSETSGFSKLRKFIIELIVIGGLRNSSDTGVKSGDIDRLLKQQESLHSLPNDSSTYENKFHNQKSTVANLRNIKFSNTSNVNSRQSRDTTNQRSIENDSTINPKSSKYYNPACFQETIIMDDTVIADTVVSRDDMGSKIGESRFTKLQAARDMAKKNNNFMVSEQPGSGVVLGQSVDTDFGQGQQSQGRFGAGRIRSVIQQLGETDLGLADTLEGSESVNAMQMINNRLGGG